ncbi:MAG: cytochrome c oxidase cbb3-type subunit 1 [Pseudohongiellaceae bacterium]|jgi:cytochrome c oxidase cbb3-type subunit 1
MLGLVVMFVDLLAAGVMHGYMFKALAPWSDILNALKPFWDVRTFAGGMIVIGQVLFVYNM